MPYIIVSRNIIDDMAGKDLKILDILQIVNTTETSPLDRSRLLPFCVFFAFLS